MATFKQIDFLAGGVSNASNQQLMGGSATIYLSGTKTRNQPEKKGRLTW